MRPGSKLCRAALVGLAALLGILMTATSVAAQTSSRTKLFLSPAAVTALMSSRTKLFQSSASAAAQMLGRPKFSSACTGENDAMSLLSTGAGTERSAGVDYAVFATELVAFLTKEVVRDSANEFDNTLLGSHLSSSMPDQRSEFGSHCLT